MNKLILISLILGTVFSAKPATYASTVTEGAFTLKYVKNYRFITLF